MCTRKYDCGQNKTKLTITTANVIVAWAAKFFLLFYLFSMKKSLWIVLLNGWCDTMISMNLKYKSCEWWNGMQSSHRAVRMAKRLTMNATNLISFVVAVCLFSVEFIGDETFWVVAFEQLQLRDVILHVMYF